MKNLPHPVIVSFINCVDFFHERTFNSCTLTKLSRILSFTCSNLNKILYIFILADYLNNNKQHKNTKYIKM